MTNIFANTKTYDFLLTNKTNHWLIIGGGMLPPATSVQHTDKAQPIKLSDITGASFGDLREDYMLNSATRDMFDNPEILEWDSIEGVEDVPVGVVGSGYGVSTYPAPTTSNTYLKATVDEEGAAYSWEALDIPSTEVNIVEDTSPQLGGTLNVNGGAFFVLGGMLQVATPVEADSTYTLEVVDLDLSDYRKRDVFNIYTGTDVFELIVDKVNSPSSITFREKLPALEAEVDIYYESYRAYTHLIQNTEYHNDGNFVEIADLRAKGYKFPGNPKLINKDFIMPPPPTSLAVGDVLTVKEIGYQDIELEWKEGVEAYVSPYPEPTESDTYLKATVSGATKTYSWSTVPNESEASPYPEPVEEDDGTFLKTSVDENGDAVYSWETPAGLTLGSVSEVASSDTVGLTLQVPDQKVGFKSVATTSGLGVGFQAEDLQVGLVVSESATGVMLETSDVGIEIKSNVTTPIKFNSISVIDTATMLEGGLVYGIITGRNGDLPALYIKSNDVILRLVDSES